MAKIVDRPLAKFLMGLAVRTIVPRHRAGVTLVCFDGSDRILMLRHVFHPSNPWDLPGGWLERNESPANCALRELNEETGLSANLGPVIHIAHETVPNHIIITYMARLLSKEENLILSSEILEAAWFSATELPYGLRPATRQAIEVAMDRLPGWSTSERVTNV